MGVFEMVVAIVAITAIAGLVRSNLKYKAGARPTAEQEARLARLEQRVRALEDVVGDTSYELKEKLRELER